MMTPEQRMHLISMRIEQADQAIQRVESCLANNQPELAANRIYYGLFYAILALALMTDADYKLDSIPASGDLEAMFVDMKLFISTIKAWIEANPA